MESLAHIACIVVAAGRGTRAGGAVPKQWRMLAGRAVAEHTLAALRHAGLAYIALVVHPDDLARAQALPGASVLVTGGATRAASVRAGLAVLDDPALTHVLIHDVARPLVSPALIARVCAALREAPAAAPALPVTDALWTGAEDRVTGTRERSGLYRAQTPQGFDLAAIRAAHAAFAGEPADDVEVARAAGLEVAIVEGDADNLKLTLAADFDRAERILRGRMKIRTGNGFDVHAFGPGDHVTLCGVAVPHDRGLVGHSDADVALHAVTDAIYGALAQGDIGQHFPPSDPQWKGADSAVFLRHAVDLARRMGFEIGNIDCTIICEMPKIGPHAAAMRSRMAEIAGLAGDQVSVKATTSERLGFTGRREGIACLASCALIGT